MKTKTIQADKWNDCYGEPWSNDVVKSATSHPAKFSRRLILQIYRHALDNGWVQRGDTILDPFGGVALGGFGALLNGLNWVGCELEQKFADIGNQNIELWRRRYGTLGGSATLINGDSRNLASLLSKADVSISSPPFLGVVQAQDPKYQSAGVNHGPRHSEYGDTDGQMAKMKEGNLDMALSSPPYAAITTGAGGLNTKPATKPGQQSGRNAKAASQDTDQRYGTTQGQLSRMADKGMDAAISSPPYEDSVSSGQSGIDWDKAGRPERKTESQTRQGVQGAAGHQMRYDATLSSPPFENSISSGKLSEAMLEEMAVRGHKPSASGQSASYGKNGDNLGNNSGDTFWSAARTIVQQVHQLLKPGGHAIWIVKDYVKSGKRVPFSDNWLKLCESVGFTLVCRHHAMQVEHLSTELLLDGGEHHITRERKGFFRRLHESRPGAVKIDWEEVICTVKL